MLVFGIRLIAECVLAEEWQELRERILLANSMFSGRQGVAVPIIVQRLLISAEDHRHARHRGFDVRAICRAIWRRVIDGRREGASTIEQQIIRVLSNRFEPTLRRKLREILLATLISEMLPKHVMPPLYISIGYFGWRMNGFAQACRRLGLKSNAITLDDAAALVARLKYPEPRHPRARRLAQINRRREHLKQLYRRHLIDGTYSHLGISDTNEAATSGSSFAEVVQSAS